MVTIRGGATKIRAPRAPGIHVVAGGASFGAPRILASAGSLVLGIVAAVVAARYGAASVEIVMSANRALYGQVGWTWYLFVPLSFWLIGLVVATVCKMSGARRAVADPSAHLSIVENLAPMLGLLGTTWEIGEATRAMTAESLEASVLSLAPAVGEALHSTIVGLVLAIVAFVMRHVSEIGLPRDGGRRAIAVITLVGASVVGAPPALACAEDLYGLSTAVGRAWNCAVRPTDASLRRPTNREERVSSSRYAKASLVTPPADRSQAAMRQVIYAAAAREGIEPLFAEALASAESGLNPRAVSPNRCCFGLFQLHHLTAQELGVRNIFDPFENAVGGIRYFRRMADRFQSISVALIAYNAGPTIADRWVADPSTTVPPETTRFLKHVLTTYRKLRAAP